MFRALLNLLMLISFTPINLLAEEEVSNKIENVFEHIEKDHKLLKELFGQLVHHETSTEIDISPPGEMRRKDECICVPIYLCDPRKRTIIKDGSFVLESRIGKLKANPCPITQTCCRHGSIIKELKAPPNYKCGYSSNLKQPHEDVPNSRAKFGQFPWTVVIFKHDFDQTYQCVGSLIHPKVVLTAAHCVNWNESYSVVAGAWDLKTTNELYPSQRSHVERVIPHPEFIPRNLYSDAALLILEEPFNLTEHIRTTCLVESPPEKLKRDYNNCVVSGWAFNRHSITMKKVDLTLLSRSNCESSLRNTRMGKWFELHSSFVCAYGIYGYELCRGDGGSPLVCKVDGSSGRYQQVGVMSWGVDCKLSTPNVFTNVSRIRDWIGAQFDLIEMDKNYYTL